MRGPPQVGIRAAPLPSSQDPSSPVFSPSVPYPRMPEGGGSILTTRRVMLWPVSPGRLPWLALEGARGCSAPRQGGRALSRAIRVGCTLHLPSAPGVPAWTLNQHAGAGEAKPGLFQAALDETI